MYKAVITEKQMDTDYGMFFNYCAGYSGTINLLNYKLNDFSIFIKFIIYV